MANPVHGRDCLLEMNTEGGWIPILCGTDMSYDFAPEYVLRTGPNSPARERAFRIYDWSMSVTGLTLIDNGTVFTFFYMLQLAVQGEPKEFRASFRDDSSGTKQISGYGFVGHSTITGPVSDFANGTIEILGTGAFELSTIDTVPSITSYNVFSDWWTTVNGNAFINGASAVHGYTLMSTDIIIDVAVEGQGSFIIVSGSPGNNEAKPDLANNKILFQNAFVGLERVYVEFKRPV